VSFSSKRLSAGRVPRGLLFPALLLSAWPALAQSTAGASADTVVVTGSREPLPLQRLAADVAVIDGEALRGTRADSLADLLRREAGLQLSRNGGPGQSGGLFIRGAASQQTLVLVDGVRVGSATLGFTAMESLGLAGIERVEVLRGPGSSLFGADAVGGVVNVITRSGDEGTGGEARVALGGYGAREASGGWRGRLGPVSLAFTLAREQDDGVSAVAPGDRFGSHNPDRDGHERDSAQLRLGLAPAAGQRVGLTLLRTNTRSQYDAAVYEPPTFAPDPSPDFRTELATAVQALDWRGSFGSGLSAAVKLARSEDDSSSGRAGEDRFVTERRHAQAQLAWRAGPALTAVLALEQQDDEARSSSYLEPVVRRSRALVLEGTGQVGATVAWQADLRRDDASDFGAVTSGRLGGSVALGGGWRLRAIAGSSFRAPSFNDLYFPGYGVPGLKAERGRSTELGAGWKGDQAEASLTVWRNRVNDLVAYEPDPAGCPADPAYAFGCAANVAKARLSGTTLSASHTIGALQWRAQLDSLRARDGLTGAPLPRRAETQGTLAADWRQGDWSVGASVVHLGDRPDGGIELAAETTLDLSATWRFAPGWRLTARLDNATDESRVPARDYQGLGRQAWLVLRWESGR
jgi:vitamin B12 transporter